MSIVSIFMAIKNFVVKHKKVALVVLVLLLIGGAFFIGRTTGPTKTVTETKTVTVEVEVVKHDVQVVEKKIYIQVESKNVHETETITKKPDGTVVTQIVYDDKSQTKTSDTQASSMSDSTTTTKSKTESKDTIKTTETIRPDWHMTLRVGAGIANLPSIQPALDFGVTAERRIVGPFFLGAWADVQTSIVPVVLPKAVLFGISAGLEF